MSKFLTFKVHTANLLKEICDCGLREGQGVLKIPINQFRILLCQVAERASQVDDDKLNYLMCRLTLYELADATSSDFDPDKEEEIRVKALNPKKAEEVDYEGMYNTITNVHKMQHLELLKHIDGLYGRKALPDEYSMEQLKREAVMQTGRSFRDVPECKKPGCAIITEL